MTLLEVLVAFVVAAFALGIFYEGAVGGVRNAQIAGNYEEAVSLARSHLDEVSTRQGTKPVDATGEDGPLFHYAVKVTQISSGQLTRSLLDEANNRPARTAVLYALSVTETWSENGRNRHVTLLGEAMSAPAAQQQ